MVVAGSLVASAGIASLGHRLGLAVPSCPVRALTGLDCPGCGATRAVNALVDGRVVDALDHNALVPLAVVVLAGMAVALVGRRLGWQLPDPFAWRGFRMTLLIVVVVFSVVRCIPVGPGAWLASGLS